MTTPFYAQSISDWWLSVWSSAAVAQEQLAKEAEGAVPAAVGTSYVSVYAVISGLAIIAMATSSFSVVASLLRASKRMHDTMLQCILHCQSRCAHPAFVCMHGQHTQTRRILNTFAEWCAWFPQFKPKHVDSATSSLKGRFCKNKYVQILT